MTPRASDMTGAMPPPLHPRQFTPFFPTSLPAGSSSTTMVVDVMGGSSSGLGPAVTPGTEAAEEDGKDFGSLLDYTIWTMKGVSFTVLMLRVYCKVSRGRRL